MLNWQQIYCAFQRHFNHAFFKEGKALNLLVWNSRPLRLIKKSTQLPSQIYWASEIFFLLKSYTKPPLRRPPFSFIINNKQIPIKPRKNIRNYYFLHFFLRLPPLGRPKSWNAKSRDQMNETLGEINFIKNHRTSPF